MRSTIIFTLRSTASTTSRSKRCHHMGTSTSQLGSGLSHVNGPLTMRKTVPRKENSPPKKIIGCTLMWWNDKDRILENHDYVQTKELSDSKDVTDKTDGTEKTKGLVYRCFLALKRWGMRLLGALLGKGHLLFRPL